jgi:hypothetical protein
LAEDARPAVEHLLERVWWPSALPSRGRGLLSLCIERPVSRCSKSVEFRGWGRLTVVKACTFVASRHEILSTLGQGGKGTVYKAHHRELEECVALKALRGDFTRHPEIAKRFRSEISWQDGSATRTSAGSTSTARSAPSSPRT